MGELGERLRQAREAKGISLEQAEEATKIRRRFLEALEAEDYGQLPGEAYVRGFLRNYAYYLGLNPEEALLASGRQPAAPVPQKNELGPYLNEPLDATPRARWLPKAAAVVVAAAVLVGGGWALLRYVVPQLKGPAQAQNAATVEPSATVPLIVQVDTPTPEPSPTPTEAEAATPEGEASPPPTEEPVEAPVASGLQLRLEATHRSWVSLKIDGQAAWSGTLEVGQSREWTATQTIALHSGNAGGLRVWLNGQEQPPIGALGAAADYTWTAEGVSAPAAGSTPSRPATAAPVGQPETPTYTPSPTATNPPPAGSTEAPTETPTTAVTAEGTPGPIGTPPAGPE